MIHLYLEQVNSDCGPLLCMTAELLFTDDRQALHNITYSQEQIMLLRLHHRQMIQSEHFTHRVSYRQSSTGPSAIYEPQEGDDDDIDEEQDLRVLKLGLTDIFVSTGKRDKSKRPRFVPGKRKRLFED